MRFDYNELLNEVTDLTSIEGFVATCLELKENMLFYDRDLMLAAYASTVEFWSVAALFCANLAGEKLAREAEDDIGECLKNLVDDLILAEAPLDVQSLGGHFSKGAGWVMVQRYPVYASMFRHYAANSYQAESSIDQLLREAQQSLQRGDLDAVTDRMGQVGAHVLRGERLRPVWFKIGHPRLQLWLSGLQTIASNLAITPYFSYPLEDIHTERQKRARIGGNVVVDLAAFRNFRQSIGGYTDQRIMLNPDEVDQVLSRLIDHGQPIDSLELDEQVKEEVIPLLAAVVEAADMSDELQPSQVQRAFEPLIRWQWGGAAGLAIGCLVKGEPWDPLYGYSLTALRRLGLRGLPAIRRYIRSNPMGPLHIILADLMATYRPSKRVSKLLAEIFAAAHWGKGKELVGAALSRYGGEEAQGIIERSLVDLRKEERDRFHQYLRGV